MDEYILEAEENMSKRIEGLNSEFSTIRTGRASAALFDRVKAEYYGTPTPLNQLANISIPEARMVVIQPYDQSAMGDIEKAILASDLGLNPSNDGKIIRIAIPPLTEERRKELVKQAKSSAENCRVAIRNARRDTNDAIKKSDLSEDDQKRTTDEVQKLTDKYVEMVGKKLTEKEAEIMEI